MSPHVFILLRSTFFLLLVSFLIEFDLKLKYNSQGLVKSWTKKIFFFESILQLELFSINTSVLLIKLKSVLVCESSITYALLNKENKL